jgi:putative hydrolase
VSDDNERDPEEEFRDMLRGFLEGREGIDPSRLAGAAGLPTDPDAIARMMAQLQAAMNVSGGEGINWTQAMEQAKSMALASVKPVSAIARAEIDQAFHVASLWLAEASDLSESGETPELLTRLEWIEQTFPLWQQLAEPVALNISNAMTTVLTDQAPEEMKGMIVGASNMMRQIGGTLFAMQLGQVLGQLSTEVVSGGDVGIPVLDTGRAALLPQNMAEFGEGLDIPMDQVHLYLAVRETAYARLFKHAKWLRLNFLSGVTEFARGISINQERLEEIANNFDPASPEELREAIGAGALIPPKTPAQQSALDRLETQLALIEGWVDVVTEAATVRLPRVDAIAETVRRRRASGGPAESALASLVGLELRPRRLRDAVKMWKSVTDAVGIAGRDALWDHPDAVPTTDDLDNPDALVARLAAAARGETPAPDEMDKALEELLDGKDFGPPPD